MHHTAGADTGFSNRGVNLQVRPAIRKAGRGGGGGGGGGMYASGPVSAPVRYILTQW